MTRAKADWLDQWFNKRKGRGHLKWPRPFSEFNEDYHPFAIGERVWVTAYPNDWSRRHPATVVKYYQNCENYDGDDFVGVMVRLESGGHWGCWAGQVRRMSPLEKLADVAPSSDC